MGQETKLDPARKARGSCQGVTAIKRPGATALELRVWPALRRIAAHLTGSRAVSAEGDTITSALGFWHGSSAVVLGSSQELILATSGLAHTGGSTSLHAPRA